jgi:phosphate starvation-inducible PhoH-like protein
MTSNSYEDEVFKAKRKPKNPIKFQITLNEEQKRAKSIILDNPITVLKGMAGSGKTLVACQVALDMLFNKEVDKIIITRPTVSKEDIGFLPGDIKEKMDPWLAPIYHNLYALYNKEKVDKEIELGNIEIVPFAFVRGRTFVNNFIIVDEAQNVTHSQMEAILGRLGKDSKMVICGDIAQIDLKDKKTSGFSFLSRIEEHVEGFKVFTLLQNHRHRIVAPILEVYKTFSD